MALPLPIRNHVAETILAALHDEAARDHLRTLARDRSGAHAGEVSERAARALRAIGDRALDPSEPDLPLALDQSAILFEAGLYFEVHERLEPLWLRASGVEREVVQGLIQVAVGLHHLGNGNLAGARALLHDGAAKLFERSISGLDVDPFAREVATTLAAIVALGADVSAFDWRSVPHFPGANPDPRGRLL